METMTISDVSKLLHITDDTARNRLAAGSEMPPSFRVGLRFPQELLRRLSSADKRLRSAIRA